MHELVREALGFDDAELANAWDRLQEELAPKFGPSIGVEGILFLIGVQEAGGGFQPRLKKERKQDLIMEGTHHALYEVGIYEPVSGAEGSAGWKRRLAIPELSIDQQEKLLRLGIIRYFDRTLPRK